MIRPSRIKAQSDLAGDGKRRAETSLPRYCGATNWIAKTVDTISEMNKPVCTSKLLSGIENISFAPEVLKAIDRASHIMDSEVKNRPAIQQCVVCTP